MKIAQRKESTKDNLSSRYLKDMKPLFKSHRITIFSSCLKSQFSHTQTIYRVHIQKSLFIFERLKVVFTQKTHQNFVGIEPTVLHVL